MWFFLPEKFLDIQNDLSEAVELDIESDPAKPSDGALAMNKAKNNFIKIDAYIPKFTIDVNIPLQKVLK